MELAKPDIDPSFEAGGVSVSHSTFITLFLSDCLSVLFSVVAFMVIEFEGSDVVHCREVSMLVHAWV